MRLVPKLKFEHIKLTKSIHFKNDFRLKWLELSYLSTWEASVKKRKGFKDKGKKMMLMHDETLQGLEVTVKSFVKIVQYLFTIPGVKSFSSSRLAQDPLEKFFSCQRQRGKSNENPNVYDFFKNTQALRVINSVCGNVSWGNYRGSKHAIDWEAESKPLPKHRKYGAENHQPQFCDHQPNYLENRGHQPRLLENHDHQPQLLENHDHQLQLLENHDHQLQLLENHDHQPQLLENHDHQPQLLENHDHQPQLLENHEHQPQLLENHEHQPQLLENRDHQPQLLKNCDHQPQLLEDCDHQPQLLENRDHQPQLLENHDHQPCLTEMYNYQPQDVWKYSHQLEHSERHDQLCQDTENDGYEPHALKCEQSPVKHGESPVKVLRK